MTHRPSARSGGTSGNPVDLTNSEEVIDLLKEELRETRKRLRDATRQAQLPTPPLIVQYDKLLLAVKHTVWFFFDASVKQSAS